MIRSFLLRWLFGTTALASEQDAPRSPLFSTHLRVVPARQETAEKLAQRYKLPQAEGVGAVAMDAANGGLGLKGFADADLGDALFAWYAAQGFIGYQLAGILAQHWLIDKACSMPGRDAIRNGFEVMLTGPTTPEHTEAIKKANKRFRLNRQMQEFVHMGRVFGVRVAIFKVKSSDPKYYERPFNIDGVAPGSYQGIVQVDPYWCTPQLDMAAVADPASPEFYEPTWWFINGVRYHRSHVAIFRTSQPADFLKPSYFYGGIPVPQQIMERVYGAERSANEGPQLLMTKRLMTWGTDMSQVLANQEKFSEHMRNFTALRDNFGVHVHDADDTMQQFDTALGDVDAVTLAQYQLVAAGARVPLTKLLGTSPQGGLGSNGEYEETSYHEHLEDIQENDLTPFLERHLELVVRSEVEPKFQMEPGTLEPHVDWNPVDSPSAEELAKRNKDKADADTALVTIGAIDAVDVRNRIRTERDSGYFGIQDVPEMGDPLAELEAATQELEALAGGEDPLEAATAALTGGADPLGAATKALTHSPLETAIAALSGQDGFDLPTAAGVILTRANGDVLWLKRSDQEENEPGKWGWPGGRIDHGEKPQDAAIRELLEETGIDYGAPIIPVGMDGTYIVFAAVSVAALDVRLNSEHVDFAWRPLSDPPRPLHRGVKAFLNG